MRKVWIQLVSLMSVLLLTSALMAEALNTFSYENFEDGALDAPWTVDNSDNLWQVVDDPHGNNKYLQVNDIDSLGTTPLELIFPTYTYNGEPNTVNPAGPELRISFRYSNGRYNGNNGSQWKVDFGNAATPDFYRLQQVDSVYPANNHFAFLVGGQDSRWGDGLTNATGIHWYWMTYEYEASTHTLHAIWYDPMTGDTEEKYFTPSLTTNTLDRITILVNLVTEKTWLFDDIRVQTLTEPADCQEYINTYGPVQGDINADCAVNISDLGAFASQWLYCNSPDDNECEDIPATELNVSASTAVNASGVSSDDLALARSTFNSASWESAIGAKTWQWLEQVGVSKHRMINMGVCEYNAPTFTPTSRLQSALYDAAQYDLIPHVIVANGVPSHLPTDVWNWTSTQWDDYEDYCYQVVKYVAVDYDANSTTDGFPTADFEVGNEVDTKTAAWYIDGTHGMGSTAMYNAYFEIYKRWANAVDRVDNDYTGLTIRIAGPALTSYTFNSNFGDFNWAEKFAADCGAQNVRCDMLTWHFYGNGGRILDRTSPGTTYPSLTGHNTIIRNALDNAGLTDTIISITEWGPDWHTNRDADGEINANHIGAAWTAGFLYDFITCGADEAVQLIFRDHYIVPTTGIADIDNWGWPAYLTADSSFPKPMFNTFKMFSMMPGTRVSCDSLSGSLGALASADSSSVAVLVFNYDFDFSTKDDNSVPTDMRVIVNDLPFSASKATITRYLIDQDHSNWFKFIAAGQPADINDVVLQQMETYDNNVVDNAVETFVTDIPKSSVTLWIITAAQ